MTHERYFPHVQVRHPSPNRYHGRGVAPALMVVHATAGHNRPGVADLAGLGDFFGNASSQVSSHVATDNEGHSARFVADSDTAWHVAAYNRLALGIEQVIPGTGAEVTEDLYRETARWLAYWSRLHGLPLQHAKVSGLHVVRRGVIRHSELGALGGGHSDPGPYDFNHVIRLARHYRRLQNRDHSRR